MFYNVNVFKFISEVQLNRDLALYGQDNITMSTKNQSKVMLIPKLDGSIIDIISNVY